MVKLAAVGIFVAALAAFAAPSPTQALEDSCWGQATAAFAAIDGGEDPGNALGQHASTQGNPRAGLRNLARVLADDGVIADDSMAALGQFVASEQGLAVDACAEGV